jgi:WD40 repeat protein
LYVFDSESQQRRQLVTGPSGATAGLAFAPDGRTLASAGADGSVRLWGLPEPPLVLAHTITAHTAQVGFATFSPDGKTLVTGSGDKTVRLWDATMWKPLGVLNGHGSGVTLGLFAASGKMLITSSFDRTIKVWDLAARPRGIR